MAAPRRERACAQAGAKAWICTDAAMERSVHRYPSSYMYASVYRSVYRSLA